MKQAQALSGILIGGTVALLATQPALATATQVTAVRLNPNTGNELKLTLETEAGEARPQILTASYGNDLVADIVNTQLNLSKGDSYVEKNPIPGISSVVVSQLDANRVRVTISGEKNPPIGQILQSEPQGITLGVSTADKNQVAEPSSTSSTPTASAPVAKPTLAAFPAPTPQAQSPKPPVTLAQTPTLQPVTPVQAPPVTPSQTPTLQPATPVQAPPVAPSQTSPPVSPVQTPASQAPTVPTVVPPPSGQAPRPDVLVPNPKITIEGNPAQATGAAQPVAPAPPFLPRAVAPPVGDIAVSNINASAGFIDLGTAVRVPRLVLRDAPVREVLSLLARSAGLNVAFTGGGAAQQPGVPGGTPGSQQTISLDLENESVQDVFNYVLQISGLQANRVGRTILVGPQLPDVARNIIARTVRLNQATVGTAVGFLISQGAEQQQVTTQTTLTVVGEGAAAQRIQNTTTQVQRITPQEAQGQAQPGAAQGASGALVLRGLTLSPDERLNSITLVGEPRKVEIATALLTQLDLRRRQVAVNVKVVDVTLQGTDAYNASFSFGIGDSFFVNDNGAASFNYGGFRPPTNAQVNSSIISPTVIQNPFNNATVFLSPNQFVTIPGTTPGTTTVFANGVVRTTPAGSGSFFAPVAITNNPLQGGFTNITPATNDTFTVDRNGNVTFTPGTVGSATTSLPSLFQFPKKFLAALQAQIQSGNAKILTDPTLVVQESQTATVQLTQEVFGGIQLSTQTDPTTNLTTQVRQPIIKNAGLTLQINVLRIDDNGFITLTVNPIVSAIGGSAQTPDGVITLVQDRRLESGQIRLRDAQTLILSGIIQQSDQTTVSKVPILGDIPILGALFRSTSRTNQRQEVIVLLTPQIINDSADSSFGYTYTPGRDARQLMQR